MALRRIHLRLLVILAVCASFLVAPPSSGTASATSLTTPIAGIAAPTQTSGYWLAGQDGGVFAFGNVPYLGSLPGQQVSVNNIVGIAAKAAPTGYWLVGADGGVFTFGDAGFHGSLAGTALNSPIVGMVATSDGGGYWLVGRDGGVYAFGNAPFKGSLPGIPVSVDNIVGIARTPDNQGYWLVGADGGVYTFGNAGFYGSLGGQQLAAPISGIASTGNGAGYWLVGRDGGVFAFGNAAYHGGTAGIALNGPVVGIAPRSDDGGYWLGATDGGVFAFGNAPFYGSIPGHGIGTPPKDPTTLVDRILALARSQIGVHESPQGCWTVPGPGHPAPFEGVASFTSCHHWCAEFATWVWANSGVPMGIISNVHNLADWGRAKGIYTPVSPSYKGRPGDIVILDELGPRQHAGIVTGYDPATDSVLSIDGNWGDAVAEVTHPVNSQIQPVTGFLTPFSAFEPGGTVQLSVLPPSGGGPVDPEPPLSLSASALDAAAQVTWAAPVSPGDSPLDHYTVVATNGSGTPVGGVAPVTVPASTTSATVPGLTNGTSYRFLVSVYNASGSNSALSNAVTPTDGGGTGSITAVGASGGHNDVGATLVLPRPAGTAAGDVLVAGVATRGTPAVTAPAGWSLIRTREEGASWTLQSYVRVAGSSEPASYTWTLSEAKAAAGTVGAYRGVDTTQPVDVSGGQVNVDLSASITAPSVATTAANAMLVGLFAYKGTAAITPPAGMTERAEDASNAPGEAHVTIETADVVQATAGDTGTKTATADSANASAAELVALRPAPGGGGGGTGTITTAGSAAGHNDVATTLVMSRPAGTAAGDVLVAGVATRGTPTVTPPAGWTLIRTREAGSSWTLQSYVRVAGTSEPASYTWTLSDAKAAAGTVTAYRGVDTTNPVDTAGGQLLNVEDTAITAPSVTTTAANAMLVGIFTSTGTVSVTPPAGMTERAEDASDAPSQAHITIETADAAQAGAGATGTKTATADSANKGAAQLIALRPAG